MISAAPPGPYASYCASSYETPGSSPVPRRMARLMLSAGMFCDFASAMIVRKRGFISGSPPPPRAATVNSLIRRVKILPRLASRAPFLCLIEAHLEWPDIQKLLKIVKILPLFREDDPDIRARVPWAPAVVAEHAIDGKPGAIEPLPHFLNRQRSKGQLETVLGRPPQAPFHITLRERRQPSGAILVNRLDEREVNASSSRPAQLHTVRILAPVRHIRHE